MPGGPSHDDSGQRIITRSPLIHCNTPYRRRLPGHVSLPEHRLNARPQSYSSSVCAKWSDSVNAIARRGPRRWRRADAAARATTNCRCRSERAFYFVLT
jgi:hypothetical protein